MYRTCFHKLIYNKRVIHTIQNASPIGSTKAAVEIEISRILMTKIIGELINYNRITQLSAIYLPNFPSAVNIPRAD